jgi:hypothetical protein
MKKLLLVIMVVVGVLGFVISVKANVHNNDPIKEILGVEYTVSPVEFTQQMWAWYEGEIMRWQMVETHQPLNMRHFTKNDNFSYAAFGGLWTTKTGDVKIATQRNGQQWLSPHPVPEQASFGRCSFANR